MRSPVSSDSSLTPHVPWGVEREGRRYHVAFHTLEVWKERTNMAGGLGWTGQGEVGEVIGIFL